MATNTLDPLQLLRQRASDLQTSMAQPQQPRFSRENVGNWMTDAGLGMFRSASEPGATFGGALGSGLANVGEEGKNRRAEERDRRDKQRAELDALLGEIYGFDLADRRLAASQGRAAREDARRAEEMAYRREQDRLAREDRLSDRAWERERYGLDRGDKLDQRAWERETYGIDRGDKLDQRAWERERYGLDAQRDLDQRYLDSVVGMTERIVGREGTAGVTTPADAVRQAREAARQIYGYPTQEDIDRISAGLNAIPMPPR